MDRNDNPETKKRKTNDDRAMTLDGVHDVNTNKTNNEGGSLPSYMSARGDGTSSGPPCADLIIHRSLCHQMEENGKNNDEDGRKVGKCEQLRETM